MHCYLTGMAFKSLSQGLCHPLCCVAEEPLSFHLICSTLIHSTPHPKFPEPTSLPRYTSFHYFPQVFPPLAHLAPTPSQSWLTPFPLLSCPEHHCFQLWLETHWFSRLGPFGSLPNTGVPTLHPLFLCPLPSLKAELGKHR